jgi:lipopolysaccharide transport system permease protein
MVLRGSVRALGAGACPSAGSNAVTLTDSLPLQPPPGIRPTRIRRADKLPWLNLEELWRHRELCWVLTWRNVRVRYKQTVLGASWAILQPLMLMVVFTIFFGWLTRIPSDGLPYSVFVYTGLAVWQFFARAFNEGSASIANSPHLVTKIYFPRLYLPTSVVMACLVDLFFGLFALAVMLIWYDIVPGWPVLLLPLLILLAVITGLGASFLIAPAHAIYRDVAHLLPFLTQVWMFASPVVYPSSLVPPEWRWLYDLNPMVTVVDGFRWALTGVAPLTWHEVASGTCVSGFVLVLGYLYFRRRETIMSDIV